VAAVIEAATGLALMIHPPLLSHLLLGEGVSGAGMALGRIAGFALLRTTDGVPSSHELLLVLFQTVEIQKQIVMTREGTTFDSPSLCQNRHLTIS
jgi:hypothetical protein